MIIPAVALAIILICARIVIRLRNDTLGMLGVAIGTMFNAVFLTIMRSSWAIPVSPDYYTAAVVAFIVLSLTSLGFFTHGVWRLRKKRVSS